MDRALGIIYTCVSSRFCSTIGFSVDRAFSAIFFRNVKRARSRAPLMYEMVPP